MKKFFIILVVFIVLPAFADESQYMNLNWWNRFDDDNLTQNLSYLYQNNLDLKNAALKIKENEQMVKAQFASQLPFASLSVDLYRDFQGARQQFGSMQIPKYSQNNYNIPLTVGYEIDIWGKNRYKTKSQKEQLNMAHERERATYISLSSNFASDYYNLIKADKLIEVQSELIKTHEHILSKISDKYKAGLCPVTELLAQQKILTSLKEEYNLHLQTRDVLINALRAYLALTSDDIKRNNFEDVKLIGNISKEYSSKTIEKRPDYKEQEANLKKVGFEVKVAKKEFLPTFTIFGQVGLNAYQLSSLFNPASQLFNAGVAPNWDLFSGGRKKAFLKLKKYEYEEALNNYQNTYLLAVKEVNSSLVDYKTALNNYNEAKKRIETEAKIYDLAKDKNKIGSSSELDVLLAKEAHLATYKDIISNKIDVIITTIGLYKALGGVDLCDIEKI